MTGAASNLAACMLWLESVPGEANNDSLSVPVVALMRRVKSESVDIVSIAR